MLLASVAEESDVANEDIFIHTILARIDRRIGIVVVCGCVMDSAAYKLLHIHCTYKELSNALSGLLIMHSI